MDDLFLNKFCLVFDRKNTISYNLFLNVMTNNNVYSLYGPLVFNNSYLAKFYNRYFYKLCIVHRLFKRKNYKNRVVVLTNESLLNISLAKLRYIKAKAKAIVLFIIDEFYNNYESVQKVKKLISENRELFSLIYTFSEKDARENSLLLNQSYYSKMNISERTSYSDLFFVGSLKNRSTILNDIFDYLSSNGINCKFIISTNRENRINKYFKYKTISYSDCIENVLSSNCILDLADNKQTGMTLRYFEAVVYNKKLLTNNENIINMPYFNEDYMKVIKDVEDIKKVELDWFKDNTNINYKYHGEFEPKYFLENILSLLQ